MKLSNAAVRAAKPRDKPYKLADGAGMYLLVRPDGKRYWRLDYRFRQKRKTLALGVYPEVSLKDARRKRETARTQIAEGADPGHVKKIENLTGAVHAGNTFRLLADELVEKMIREQRADVTVEKTRWLFRLADPYLGERPIAEITAAEILLVLRSVEAHGRYETARRLRSKIGQVFRLAVATGRAKRDPTVDLRGAITTPTVKHHAAITKPGEIGALLRAIDGYSGHLTTKLALQLLALTFVRPGELRRAEWCEFDLEAGVWEIAAEKMKMRRTHRAPLAAQACALIEDLHPLTGQSRFLFPAVNNFHRPMSENTLTAALRRLGYTGEEMTAHGFRAMAATRLNEMGQWTPDAIERQLAHQDANAIRRAYTHAAEYWDERVRMMQAWANYLDQLRNSKPFVDGAYGARGSGGLP